MKKIILALSFIFLISLSFVTSQIIQNPSTVFIESRENSETEKTCRTINGCYIREEDECYTIGTRLTIPPKYKQQELSWRNETYLYCSGEDKKFVSQKITEETCENDFECLSNKCYDDKCEQKNKITIKETYNDNINLIKELSFQDKETFYFNGLNKNYSIGFGKNDSNFIFFINDESAFYKDKILILDENSQFILNKIFFEDDITKANVTLIESKIPFNDSKKLIEKLTCEGLFVNEECKKEGESFEMKGREYIVENKSPKEILTEQNLPSITGGAIGTSNENIFHKIANFFKNLFSKN